MNRELSVLLSVGAELLGNGAHSSRIRYLLGHLSDSLGLENVVIIIHFSTLSVSSITDNQVLTGTRRVEGHDINMDKVALLSDLCVRAHTASWKTERVEARLAEIRKKPKLFPTRLTQITVATSCSAFAMLYGGTWQIFAITFLGSFCGILWKEFCLKRKLNRTLAVLSAAFISTLVIGTTGLDFQTGIATAASVLFLIPGVQMINALIEFLDDRPLIGLGRLFYSLSVMFALATGVALGIKFTH